MEPTSNLQPAQPSVDRARDATENALRAALGELGLEALISEIARYLAVIEVFRREGCEPCWS